MAVPPTPGSYTQTKYYLVVDNGVEEDDTVPPYDFSIEDRGPTDPIRAGAHIITWGAGLPQPAPDPGQLPTQEVADAWWETYSGGVQQAVMTRASGTSDAFRALVGALIHIISKRHPGQEVTEDELLAEVEAHWPAAAAAAVAAARAGAAPKKRRSRKKK